MRAAAQWVLAEMAPTLQMEIPSLHWRRMDQSRCLLPSSTGWEAVVPLWRQHYHYHRHPAMTTTTGDARSMPHYYCHCHYDYRCHCHCHR